MFRSPFRKGFIKYFLTLADIVYINEEWGNNIEGFAKLYKEIYGLDSLEEYLELLMAEGEFDHRKNQPVKSFFSGLVGIIPFVKPIYELATGKEIITGEDLSDFEQGMNGVSLALDCFVVGKAVSALSDLTKPTLGQIAKLGGRTLAVDALTYGASYGTTMVLEDTNLPNELKLLLSLGVGLAVSHVSGKYLIKSADGNVISEVDENTLKGSGGTKTSGSAFGEMNPADTARYNQYWDDVAKGLDTNTRVKLNQWEYRPNADLYNKYKSVYNNPKYFDQSTGNVNYPGMNGDKNIDGFVNGQHTPTMLEPETVIDRYGSNGSGKYFSPAGTSYEQRALPPFMEEQPYTKYKVVRPLEVDTGKIAPWFEQPGQGTQFLSKYSVEELKKLGYIIEIK